MDVRIIPKTGGFDSVCPQHLNALIGAGGAADMQKGIHKSLLRKDIFFIILPWKIYFRNRSRRNFSEILSPFPRFCSPKVLCYGKNIDGYIFDKL
jgi:hypothetical protein